MQREKGPYWVRRFEGDASQSAWEIMHWEGEWFRDFTDTRRYEADLSEIGPRILNPNKDTRLDHIIVLENELGQTGLDLERHRGALLLAVEVLEEIKADGQDVHSQEPVMEGLIAAAAKADAGLKRIDRRMSHGAPAEEAQP